MTNSVCPSFGRRCSTSFLRPSVIAQAGLSMCQGVGSPDLSRLHHEPWSQGYLPDPDAGFTPGSRPEEISTIIRDPPMNSHIPVTWPLFFHKISGRPVLEAQHPARILGSVGVTPCQRFFHPKTTWLFARDRRTISCFHPKKESAVGPCGIPTRFAPQ